VTDPAPTPRAKWATHRLAADALGARLFERLAAVEAARLREAFLDVDGWGDLVGAPGVEFELHDLEGDPVIRAAPEPGDFVRTRPFGKTGGDHWTLVESVADGPHQVELVLRPSHDPSAFPPARAVTCHYLDPGAKLTFALARDGARVSARVHRIGERPNDGEGAGGTEAAARNARLFERADRGLWDALVDGLLELE